MLTRRLLLAAAFIGCVYGANWALDTYGVLKVGPYDVPAGALFAGISFGLRDALHEAGGLKWRRWIVGCIVVGAALSYVVSDGVQIPGGLTSIAVASGLAFLLSEAADAFIYAPLRERQWVVAVFASNVIGSIVDTVIFLYLAFGSLEFFSGQMAGKLAMVALALPVVAAVRRAR